MLDACLAEVLCMFANPYDGYMETVCSRGDEVVNLLEISGAEFPESFSHTRECSLKDLQDVQGWLIKETQEKFFARKGERHETKVPQWIMDNSDKIEVEALNFINALTDAKQPQNKEPDCVAILGASRLEFSKRNAALGFFDNIEEKNIYLLAGTRKLWDREFQEGEREKWSEKYPGQELTEAIMMQEVFRSEYPHINFNLIATEPCNAKTQCARNRANTEDTVEAFLDANPNCSNVSFISRAPNIAPQYEAVRPVMEARARNINFEVVGGGASISEIDDPNAKMHLIHHILMPFAGALWGSFERVSAEISEKFHQCPAGYEFLKNLKHKMKDNFTGAKKSDKKLVTPL